MSIESSTAGRLSARFSIIGIKDHGRRWRTVKIMPIHVSALSPTLLRYDMTALFVLVVSCMLVKDLRSTKLPDFLWESTSKPVMSFKSVMMRLNIFI